MGSSKLVPMKIGLANRFIETTKLSAIGSTLEHNRKVARRLVDKLQAASMFADAAAKISRGFLLRKVPVELVREFLINFRNDGANPLTDPVLVDRYIEERKNTELSIWDIFLVSVNEGDVHRTSDLLGIRIGVAGRSVDRKDLSKNILSIGGASRRLGSPGDEKVGVDPLKAELALEELRKRLEGEGKKLPKTIPDRIFREVREFPLLIIRLIRPKLDDVEAGSLEKLLPEDPVVGWGISFPNSELNNGRVEYVVNTVKMKELFGEEEDEEEAAGDES
jgi:hypothetical protein